MIRDNRQEAPVKRAALVPHHPPLLDEHGDQLFAMPDTIAETERRTWFLCEASHRPPGSTH